MPTVQKSLRIPKEVAEVIELMAEVHHRDFSALANELLEEAVKMRRCPGIDFVQTPTSRRSARVVGSGLEVWEVIRDYKGMDSNWDRLKAGYEDMLTERQLRSALAYYACYPEEIDRRIARDEEWTPERLYSLYPFMRPPKR